MPGGFTGRDFNFLRRQILPAPRLSPQTQDQIFADMSTGFESIARNFPLEQLEEVFLNGTYFGPPFEDLAVRIAVVRRPDKLPAPYHLLQHLQRVHLLGAFLL